MFTIFSYIFFFTFQWQYVSLDNNIFPPYCRTDLYSFHSVSQPTCIQRFQWKSHRSCNLVSHQTSHVSHGTRIPNTLNWQCREWCKLEHWKRLLELEGSLGSLMHRQWLKHESFHLETDKKRTRLTATTNNNSSFMAVFPAYAKGLASGFPQQFLPLLTLLCILLSQTTLSLSLMSLSTTWLHVVLGLPLPLTHSLSISIYETLTPSHKSGKKWGKVLGPYAVCRSACIMYTYVTCNIIL